LTLRPGGAAGPLAAIDLGFVSDSTALAIVGRDPLVIHSGVVIHVYGQGQPRHLFDLVDHHAAGV